MPHTNSAFSPDWTTPPGATIARIISRRGLSLWELASEIDVPEHKIQGLMSGDIEIDESLADRLGATLGPSMTFWLKRESQYREDLRRLDPSSNTITDLDANWARMFPINDMRKLGWIPAAGSRQDTIRTLSDFFGISSIQSWRDTYQRSASLAAFRTSPSFKSNPAAVVAWLRWAELQSATMECREWHSKHLLANIGNMRKLTRRNHPSKFIPELKEICADSGVALVIGPTPSGCHASGATRFVSETKAAIILSLRHKSDDHFWFTFFHEVGHLLLHGKDCLFLEDNSNVLSSEEMEANAFSQDVLIPPSSRDELHTLPISSNTIQRYSVHIGISSGIVVGQLQHMGRLRPNQMNHLKRRYKWQEFEDLL